MPFEQPSELSENLDELEELSAELRKHIEYAESQSELLSPGEKQQLMEVAEGEKEQLREVNYRISRLRMKELPPDSRN
jgi:hypothetical protein